MAASVETIEFRAETKHLLDVMIHSLYTTKDIFIRELISNASDALDRLRFEAIQHPELMDSDAKLEIRIETDPTARTLTIHDNGIGMTREEVIKNIGTIAESGTRALAEQLREGASNDVINEFIGQFGVGFYSAFMVADRVSLITRRAGEQSAVRWESNGEGQYSLSECEKPGRGTSVTLHLKPAAVEEGIEDFTDKWILARSVKRYSNFISYPILYRDQREEVQAENDDKKTIVVEDKLLNSMKPIWTRPEAEVSDAEYVEFYQQIAHDTNEPLQRILVKAEGRLEYRALLFIPATAPYDLHYHAFEGGLRLYGRGVSIQERCEELLPRYLRFMKGIVDTTNLPLNISRQMLQEDRQILQIQKWLTKRILNVLEQMNENDKDRYLTFWDQFGRSFKEGVSSDYENRDRIVGLLLFVSSNNPSELTSLKDYVARMKEGQKEIFYLTGESRSVVENSPHLEAFKERGYEVLYLLDPVDELVVQSLTHFDEKKLKSVIKGVIQFGDDAESLQTEKELKEEQERFSSLLAAFQKHLDAYVKEVRLTNRLTASPVCLVGSEIDYSPQMERLLQMGKGARPKQRRIMELNPRHKIFIEIQKRFEADPGSLLLRNFAELLLGHALLAEGSELPDPVRYNELVAELMFGTLSSTQSPRG
jgi:molecular chaperone HtpG